MNKKTTQHNYELTFSLHTDYINMSPVIDVSIFVYSKCALTQTSTICPYQIRLGINNEPFHNISQLARNRVSYSTRPVYVAESRHLWLFIFLFHNIFVKRYVFLLQITAVCDFYTYARYITQGLVKSDGKIQFSKIDIWRSHQGQNKGMK